MKIEEVKIGRPDMYKGYVIEHNISVYITNEEDKDIKDLTKFVLEAAGSMYDLNEYEYSFGRRERSYFGCTYHVHLLKKIK